MNWLKVLVYWLTIINKLKCWVKMNSLSFFGVVTILYYVKRLIGSHNRCYLSSNPVWLQTAIVCIFHITYGTAFVFVEVTQLCKLFILPPNSLTMFLFKLSLHLLINLFDPFHDICVFQFCNPDSVRHHSKWELFCVVDFFGIYIADDWESSFHLSTTKADIMRLVMNTNKRQLCLQVILQMELFYVIVTLVCVSIITISFLDVLFMFCVREKSIRCWLNNNKLTDFAFQRAHTGVCVWID